MKKLTKANKDVLIEKDIFNPDYKLFNKKDTFISHLNYKPVKGFKKGL
jgi:hypothetical protein